MVVQLDTLLLSSADIHAMFEERHLDLCLWRMDFARLVVSI
jgi:hypothetical protein